jgi:hypothetical protein
MASRLEMLQALCDRLEAEHLQVVEMLASTQAPVADFPADRVRRLVDLHALLCAVRDEIARHGPRMGYGPDSLSIGDAASANSESGFVT